MADGARREYYCPHRPGPQQQHCCWQQPQNHYHQVPPSTPCKTAVAALPTRSATQQCPTRQIVDTGRTAAVAAGCTVVMVVATRGQLEH